MKTRNLMIGLGVATALAAGVGTYSYTASAQDGRGYGPGMMGRGYGPGMMGGGGPGMMGPGMMGSGMMGPGGRGEAGPGEWNCPAAAQINESTSGQGQGYGPGNHMRGWDRGFGPGMMQGYGRRGDAPGTQNLNLTTDDVKTRVERWLTWRGNSRLKVGEVKEKDADTITADVVTKENSLVERFIVDRRTGFFRRDNS
jgi:hypothetical protein